MRILIIKPSSLGDIICALPVAQSIRQQCPNAEISWVVKERFAEIVRRCPTVNGDILLFHHSQGLKGLLGLARSVRELWERPYDVVLDFQGLLRSGLMTAAVRSPLKIGGPWAREGSHFAYHKVAARPEKGFETHAIEKLLQFLPCIGLKPELRDPIELCGESPDILDPRLQDRSPIVMIPNSRGAHKEWPFFPQLTQLVTDVFPEAPVVWDSHLQWTNPDLSHPDRLINITSKSSLLQMVELLRRARLVIANDSGPLHIAAALGRPTLGLFGPTSPERFGPYPLDHPRNHFLTAPGQDMRQLPAEVVFGRVMEILQRSTSLCRAA